MKKEKEQYSLKTLEKLYTKLVNQQPFGNPSSVNIPEILNEMGKIIVWGERQKNGIQNGDIFDFICQVKLFDLLLQIFTKCKNVQTINSVIGFYNMLLTNISKPQTTLYLLSHPCILSMELTKFGTMANQLAQYYINFLKGLSRKIDFNTIHIFFNKRYPNFPLLYQTIRFFNHPQNLVRTTCRNIILSVFRFSSLRNNPDKILKSQKQKQVNNNSGELLLRKLNCIHKYLTSFPFCIYYIHESNFIKQYWKILDHVLQPEGGENSIYQNQQYQIQNLDEIISDHEQLLIYLDDLLLNQNSNNLKNSQTTDQQNSQFQSQKSKQVTTQEMFVSAFANQCLSQLVMSLCSIKKAYLGIKTSLLVFILLMNNIRNQFVLNALLFCLFSKYYPKSLTHKLLNPIDSILSYNKEWKFKGFWDGHDDKISQFCSKVFYQDKSLKGDLSKLNESLNYSKKSSSLIDATMSIFGNGANYYEREVQKIQRIFSINILKFNQECQQTQRQKQQKFFKNKSFSCSFKNFLNQLPLMNTGNINLLNFDQNPVVSNVLSFLQSKDDTLVMLTLCLLQKIYSIKNLNQDLIKFCKLSIKPTTKDFSSVITIQKIVLNCLRIFIVDPPNFRICTYKQASKIFLHYVKIYQNDNFQMPIQLMKQAKKALKVSISRISPYLYGGKQWEKVVQLYLMITRQNNKFRKNNLKTYGLIPDQMHSNQANNLKIKFTDQLYENVPRTFDQQIGRDLWIFIIVKQLLSNLSNNKTISKYFNFKVDLVPTNQNKSTKYQEGKGYSLQKDQHFKGFYKKINEQKYNDCDIVLLGGYLVLGSEGEVQYKLPYQQTYLLTDKSDPRKLLLQSNRISISLQLQNLKQVISLKQNFIENKNLLLKCHLSNLIKQIQSLQNQLNN